MFYVLSLTLIARAIDVPKHKGFEKLSQSVIMCDSEAESAGGSPST